MGLDQAVERLLRRDRAVVLAALILIALLAWLYTIHLAAQMNSGGAMPGMSMDGGAADVSDSMAGMNMGDSSTDTTTAASLPNSCKSAHGRRQTPY